MYQRKANGILTLTAATLIVGASAATAQCDFAGETITIVVPFGEGGGT